MAEWDRHRAVDVREETMPIEIIGLVVGAAIIAVETAVLIMLVHHIRKLNEHTQKLDSHVAKLDASIEELHEHSHHMEKDVDRLCSCIPSPQDDG